METLDSRILTAIGRGSPGDQLYLASRSSGLLHFFEVVVTGDGYEHSKPHPDAYLTAIQKLGLKPDQCLAVEDVHRGRPLPWLPASVVFSSPLNRRTWHCAGMPPMW